MGLFFTLLYIFTAYVTPTVLFGELAEYRVELIIIVLAIVTSLPKLQSAELGKPRETWALLALTIAVMLSFWGHGLFGLSVSGMIDFLTQVLVFPLILLNCRTRTHIQAVVVTIALACAFTIFKGVTDLYSNNLPSPYIYVQSYGRSDAAYRLQGQGPINDPNDFGQLLAFTMPAMFLFWRKGKMALNLVRVVVPAGFLFAGLFYTHSRGAMLALLVVLIVSLRRKIGLLPSLVMAAVGFVAATALGWAGGAGREVTADQGQDRLEAWSTGLELIKHNPIFGVGYKRFTEYYIITAHNTVVVCAAELGLLGFFCWIVFTQGTLRDLLVTNVKIKKKKRYAHEPENEDSAPVMASQPVAAQARLAYPGVGSAAMVAAGTGEVWGRFPGGGGVPVERDERLGQGGGKAQESAAGSGVETGWAPGEDGLAKKQLPPEEIRRMASVLVSAISGYLAAGWFLSRAYVMALFLAGAVSQVVYRLALEQGIAAPRMPWGRLLKLSAITSVGLILFVYVGLIVQHLGK